MEDARSMKTHNQPRYAHAFDPPNGFLAIQMCAGGVFFFIREQNDSQIQTPYSVVFGSK